MPTINRRKVAAILAVTVVFLWLVGLVRGCTSRKVIERAQVKVRSKPAPKTSRPTKIKVVQSPQTGRKTVKRPVMPLKLTRRGQLDGLVLIIDPGHGGRDPGCKWTENFTRGFSQPSKVIFWEAAYTMRLARELADLARGRGATVYLTAYSSVFDTAASHSPQKPETVPRDAVFLEDGRGVRAGERGLKTRAAYANRVAKKHKGQRVALLSLHIDSMPVGFSGGHVCVPRGHEEKPLVRALAQAMVDGGYARQRPDGSKSPVISARGLAVLRHARQVKERILIELATPVSKEDSYRLRSKDNRQKLLRRIINALIETQTAAG